MASNFTIPPTYGRSVKAEEGHVSDYRFSKLSYSCMRTESSCLRFIRAFLLKCRSAEVLGMLRYEIVHLHAGLPQSSHSDHVY
jgi:hypothetical protein